jgi:nucleoside-diphosphate kinase
MKERTLAIIKPDGVQNNLVGTVLKRLEEAGYKLVAMKMVRMTREQARAFYGVHEGKPFFEGLTDFMSSGPCVAVVLEGDNVIAGYRKMMGATDPVQAETGTIRHAFATDGRKNVVHGSDSAETAHWEIGFFFNRIELPEGSSTSH